MANWTTLKAAIADVIKTNGNQEITGATLQNVLNSIVNSVGENATFAGIATPETNPGVPDGPIFYIANTAGVYNNFGSASPYIMPKRTAVLFIYTSSSNWVVKTLARNTLDDFIDLPNIEPVLPYFSDSNRPLILADWFFRDMFCKKIRYRSITSIYIDVIKPGTLYIISAPTVDIYSKNPELEVSVLATITAEIRGWQKIDLDEPIKISIYEQLGVRLGTAVIGYFTSNGNISDVVSPYDNWVFNESWASSFVIYRLDLYLVVIHLSYLK